MKSYNMKEACFACTTPYQVMGAISIVQTEHMDSDIYIFGMFPNYDTVATELKKYNIFSDVYAVDCTKIGSPGRLKGLLQMVFSGRTVRFYLPENVCYREFYSSSRALPKMIMMHVLSTRNPDMCRVIYEDGMGTYSSYSHPLNATKLMRKAESILRWNIDDRNKTSMMAYIPELVDPPEFIKEKKVEQMPRLEFDDHTVSLLENVFASGNVRRIKNRVIIFDTLRGHTKFMSETQYDLLDRCYDEIVSSAGPDHVICKPHPRSLFATKAEVEMYRGQEVPMEVLYASMSDIEERVLISFTSSAVFTPKIMFGKEPTVICLHRILNGTRGSRIFEGIYQKFSETYRNSSKVMAPRSVEELKSCLKQVG